MNFIRCALVIGFGFVFISDGAVAANLSSATLLGQYSGNVGRLGSNLARTGELTVKANDDNSSVVVAYKSLLTSKREIEVPKEFFESMFTNRTVRILDGGVIETRLTLERTVKSASFPSVDAFFVTKIKEIDLLTFILHDDKLVSYKAQQFEIKNGVKAWRKEWLLTGVERRAEKN